MIYLASKITNWLYLLESPYRLPSVTYQNERSTLYAARGGFSRKTRCGTFDEAFKVSSSSACIVYCSPWPGVR